MEIPAHFNANALFFPLILPSSKTEKNRGFLPVLEISSPRAVFYFHVGIHPEEKQPRRMARP